MTSLEELLCRRIGPKETTITLSSLVDPETGKPAPLRFRVPTSVEASKLFVGRTTLLDRCAAVVAHCLIEPSLTSTVLQAKCEEYPGAYVEPEMVAARVFTMNELDELATRLFEVAKIVAPFDEIEETAKN